MARIGIDLDGVCYDFTGEVCRAAGKDPEQARTWEFYRDWGWDGRQFNAFCRSLITDRTIFRYGGVLPGTKEGIWALLEAGHEIFFVTDRKSLDPADRTWAGVEISTVRWIREELDVQRPAVIFSGEKAKVAVANRLDYFVDDKPENIQSLVKAGIKAWVMDQSWNQDMDDDYARVASLEDFAREVAYCEEETVKVADGATGEVRVTSSTGGQKGQKLAQFSLIPKKSLWKVAELYGRGAEKYDRHNWRRGYPFSLSQDALERHYALWCEGEELDPETGCHHLAAVVFHALSLLAFIDEHPEFDDRFCSREIPARPEEAA